MTEFICYFDQVEKVDRDQVGSKGYALARLHQAGFPVPPSFVVTTDAYRAFITANELDVIIADALAVGEPVFTSARIAAAFEEAEMPSSVATAIGNAYLALGADELAVRSSALAEDNEHASFAGQYETALGVVSGDALLGAVRRCWASLWCERALAYRRRSGPEDNALAMAVVVQKMAPATQAGVAFTLDPISGRRDAIVVEAVAGLGDSLVSGRTTPHRYILRRGKRPLDSGDGVLDATRLEAIVRLAQKVEAWAGQPQDIEWALDEMGRVYLLQARPITVVGGTASEGVIRWTRDNVGEVLPDPVTPLSWSVLNPLGNRSFAGVLRRLGAGDVPVSGLFGRFYGRVYLNQTLFQSMMSRFYLSRAGWRALPRLALTALRTLLLLRRLPRESYEITETILEWRCSERDLDLATLAPGDVLDRLGDWRHLGTAAMEIHLAVTVMGELLYQALDKLLAFWGNGAVTAAMLTSGLTGVRSAEAGQALADLAQQARKDKDLLALVLETPPEALMSRLADSGPGQILRAQIERFLVEHGHSAAQEFELAAPRWRDDPAIVLSALRVQARTARELPIDAATARLATTEQIEDRLGPVKCWFFRYLLCRAQVFTATRENLKYHFVIAHSRLRDLYLALAKWLIDNEWLVDAEDVFFLIAEEVAALIEGQLTPDQGLQYVTERRQAWVVDQRVAPPLALDQLVNSRLRPVSPSTQPSRHSERLLRGFAASPGSYTGRARVVLTLGEGADLEPGEVLVVPATSPGWAPILLTAGALVTEIGGMLSHGAIIAREYGLPAVLNVTDATRRIRTGSLIHVDGSRGVVQALEESS